MQVDPMADMLTGINPYNFGYNNPIKFNDPTGLIGQSDTTFVNHDLPTFVVTAKRPRKSSSLSASQLSLLNDLKWSSNPVHRGLYSEYKDNGLAGVRNVLSHSRTLNMSTEGYEDAIAKGEQTRQALGKLMLYGVGGTMVATVGAPILVDMIVAKVETAGVDMAIEAGSQIFTNLIVDQRVGWGNLDIADIILAGFTKPGMGDVVGATVDLTYDGGFNYLGKGDRTLNNVIGDAILGSITTGQRQLMDKSSITDINKYILDAFNKTKVSVVEKAVNKNE